MPSKTLEYSIKDIRLEVKSFLLDLDMTQKELAFKSGVSNATITSLLGGRMKDIRLSTLSSIADAIGCDLLVTFFPPDK